MMTPQPLIVFPWTRWDIATFLHMHATASSPAWAIDTAVLIARWLLAVIILVAIWQLLRHRSGAGLLRIVAAWFVSNRIEALIGTYAFHPRPFAAGYGHAWMAHAANNSMPSSHVTLGLILVAVMIRQKYYRCGALLTVLTIALAWSRIYVGIHWPADMIGALLSASLSVGVAYAAERLLMLARHRRWMARGWGWIRHRRHPAVTG